MVWLFANTILLSIFSGQLYEFIINGKIIEGIESREELFTKENWKTSRIHALDPHIIDVIISGVHNNDEMAKQFASRMEKILPKALRAATE